MSQRERFYITTAIDYVNSKPHVGTAYEKIGADAIARYRRRRDQDVLFVMGNDEHSLNVLRSARKQGLDPRVYCDQMEQVFRQTWASLDIRFDDFIRTTQPRHRTAVETLFRKVQAAGDLYEAAYEGLYCESCESFKGGDDLENGNCKIHQTPCTLVREQNVFFRLSKYTEPLRNLFRTRPDFMEPERYRNEMLGLLEQGLQDVSVSRSALEWGIPMPGFPGQVVWVWFDALINYISAVGYGDADDSQYRRMWPVDVHVIGKDITRFHTLIWPAMLMSAGEPVPKKVWAHGWVHHRGLKMSKSRGTAISLDEAIAFQGPDALRYFLLREIPFDRDGDFTFERFHERYNTDLANTWGNLLSRVVTIAAKMGAVSRPEGDAPDAQDIELIALYQETVRRYCQAMDGMLIHQALDAIWALLYHANAYIDGKAPWKMKDPAQAPLLTRTMRNLLVVLRETALMLAPVLPTACRNAWTQLGNPGDFDAEHLDPGAGWDRYDHSYRVVRGNPLFPKSDWTPPTSESEPLQETSKLEPASSPSAESAAAPASASAPAPAATSTTATTPAPASGATAADASEPAMDPIDYADFAKVQLRAGQILTAEAVKKAKKLLRLTVDVGEAEPRQILAGIALYYAPETLIGRKVVVVANLKPRELMGFESRGMLLAASAGDKLELVSPGDLPPGAKVS